MVADRKQTCCFTGHRPAKLPWGRDERAPECIALKRSMLREIEQLYLQGYRRFISGMAQGCDLYFAQAVLEFQRLYPQAVLSAVLPFSGQADRWSADDRAAWQHILAQCSDRIVLQERYDRWCMLRRDRYMVDQSSLILAVFDGTPGGTRYTLDYAAQQHLDIRILDLSHPDLPATRLEYRSEQADQKK